MVTLAGPPLHAPSSGRPLAGRVREERSDEHIETAAGRVSPTPEAL